MKKSFIVIVLLLGLIALSSCQKHHEEDLYKTAMEDIKNGNPQAAINSLEELVEKNPYSEFAPDAFFTLASLYQSMEGDSIHKVENYRKALEYYQELINKFPNNEKTPEAIFMAGFINAEYLKDYQAASFFYKKFLKMYPEHELAVSVKAELDNLGKSPEEILKEKGVELQAKGSSK
jgi:TolA-binding protein